MISRTVPERVSFAMQTEGPQTKGFARCKCLVQNEALKGIVAAMALPAAQLQNSVAKVQFRSLLLTVPALGKPLDRLADKADRWLTRPDFAKIGLL